MLRTADVDVIPEELVESVDASSAAVAAMTVVCGSSFCSSAAAAWAATDAAVLTADANSPIQGDGVYHSVLFIL